MIPEGYPVTFHIYEYSIIRPISPTNDAWGEQLGKIGLRRADNPACFQIS